MLLLPWRRDSEAGAAGAPTSGKTDRSPMKNDIMGAKKLGPYGLSRAGVEGSGPPVSAKRERN